MNDERLHVGNIGEQAEYLEVVDELLRRFAAALDLEGEDGDASLREVTLESA